MTDIILTPIVVDEIEFYVSDDGKVTGISISGLVALCGVSESTIRDYLDKLEKYSKNLEDTPTNSPFLRWVKSLYNKGFDVFIPHVSGFKNGGIAKIVTDITCAIIIEWFAFENKIENITARNTFRKFSRKGITSWIKEITGFNEEDKIDKLINSVMQLSEKVDKLQTTTTKYNNINQTTIKFMPGLNIINREIEDGDYLDESLLDGKPFTAVEWLANKGITLEDSRKRQFALMASQTYKSLKQKSAIKVMRKDKNGNLTQKVNGFTYADEPILQIVLSKLFLCV